MALGDYEYIIMDGDNDTNVVIGYENNQWYVSVSGDKSYFETEKEDKTFASESLE